MAFAFINDVTQQVFCRIPTGVADSCRYGVQVFYHATLDASGCIVPGTCTGPTGSWDQFWNDVVQYQGKISQNALLGKLYDFLNAHGHVEALTSNLMQFLLA
nr:hypothetical protein [Candidatus Sigynarchaeota archaeon]